MPNAAHEEMDLFLVGYLLKSDITRIYKRKNTSRSDNKMNEISRPISCGFTINPLDVSCWHPRDISTKNEARLKK